MSHHTVLHRTRNWFVQRGSEASTLAGIAVVAVSLSVLLSISWISLVALGCAVAAMIKGDPGCSKCNR